MILLLTSCLLGPGGGVGTDVVSLRIEPATLEGRARTEAPLEQQFTAYATFEDGAEQPIDLVSWTSSNLSAGSVDPDGVFTSVDTNGGVTELTANHLGIQATATVRVVYTEELVLDGANNSWIDAFDGAEVSTGNDPELLYPADTVRVPRNLEGLAFLWTAPEGANAFRLRLQSEITDVSIYSTDPEWFATGDLWALISASNREGRVEVVTQSGEWSGSGGLQNVKQGPPIEVTVNRLDARGSVLYWSTADRAIMRIPFGTDEAERYWPTQPDGSCIGCHLVSEANQLMAVTHDGINGVFTVVDVNNDNMPRAIVGPDDNERMTFKTASPDGQYMLGTLEGQFYLYDLASGERIGQFDRGDYYTQPDWSPDGTKVAAVRVPSNQHNDFFFQNGELVVFPFTDGRLGDPQVMVSGNDTYNYYYPSWSPDGEWLAFNRTRGQAYASPDAELFLVSADGQTTLRLDNANGEGSLQNSYPRWGPLPDDDVLWLAFSSTRDYAPEDHDEAQIWVSAIDVELARQGEDPSSAAFWLPGQDAESDNHLPLWWSQ